VWPWAEEAVEATRKPATVEHAVSDRESLEAAAPLMTRPDVALRRILHQRRSAVEMDGTTALSRQTFYEILSRAMPAPGRVPFDLLPWAPCVHLGLFAHRIDSLDPGLYLLARNPDHLARLRAALRSDAEWGAA
jgi:hypothetical protein